ncbi:mavicyanin [Mangifera indica]|uniref:mavicyanin n=1 Tax=Mangifera indica TaxID=29780 RepID=UPI001CFB981E|nr:mavicyanin [Mangifera indica]
MASLLVICFKASLFLFLFLFLHVHTVTCTEYEAGGDDGWVIPKGNDADQMYNRWASGNRFKPDDIVHFKYKEDSVMVVTEEEYQKCRSSHPFFYSNNGDTVFKLERPGLFYFISGVSGHCERGQKMIIKVLEPPANSPEQPQNQTTTDEKNNGSVLSPSMASPINIVLLVLSFLLLLFH